MEDDFILRLAGCGPVWKRVFSADPPPQPSDQRAQYGGFCLLPDPKRRRHAARFIPEI